MRTTVRCLLTTMLLAGWGVSAQNVAVTAVGGESWLHHLSRPFNDTSMGKTGHLGPPPSNAGKPEPRLHLSASPLVASQTVTLHGADLYRLNCQGCHGESGAGAPPEINSVINPVRATSAALVRERMKTAGMDMSSAAAAQLARQANSALQLRLHQGGESMPPFPHLSEAEIRALSAYLKQLAQLPGAESQQLTVQESRLRVGEHIVKSTCQTCHSAVGLDPTPRQLLDGAIPPLSSLTARVTLPALVRKVTQGAPIVMGEPAIACRGRMPVFSYLTEDEASDVYLYLTKYPPSQADANIVARAGVTGGIALLPRNDGDHKDPKDAGQTKAVVKRLLQYAGFPAILFLLFGGVILKGLPLVMPSPPRASAASGPSVRLQSVAPSGDDWPRCDADCVGAAESHETSKR